MNNKTSGIKTVKCPTCGKAVKWESASHWRPFCCERCRLIDLGEWANESHRIPGASPIDFIDPDDEENIH